VWPLARVQEVATAARKHDLRLHMDGARLWNASAASGVPERDYAAPFDTVSVCFSKGLGAPIGSALAGPADLMARARRFRKQFGGGMRQAGIIAAGALYAVEHHRERLREDHTNARTLATALAGMAGVELNPAEVETNILYFRLTSMPAPEVVNRLGEAGVRVLATGPDTIRAVTNLNVGAEDIQSAIRIFKRLLDCGGSTSRQ
jgi:threonine aldolase